MIVSDLKRSAGLAVTNHYFLCKTGVIRAPEVFRTRAGVVHWARHSLRLWIILAVAVPMALWLLPMLTSFLVDLLYPLGKQDFGKAVAGFFDGSSARINKLRAVRHEQFLWGEYAVLSLYVGSEALRSFAASPNVEATQGHDVADGADAPTLIVPRDTAEQATQVIIRYGSDEVRQPAHLADGRYRLDMVMGKGGAGQVHKAFDTRLQRAVAVKQLVVQDDGEGDFVRRFEQEARTLASLSHAHIVAVHDLVVEKGQFWIVMELLTGGDLKALIRERHGLPPREALVIARDIASALALAHSRGIVHRDIKPENVLRSPEGVWKLTDFGIAKQQSSDIKTQMGLVIGSLAYMSPEQAAGSPVDSRSDIYSLGISLYEMLSGELPFRGEMRSVLAQHLTRELPTIGGVASSVDALVQRMAAKDPEARFADCGAVIEAIEACLAEDRETLG